MSKCLIWIQGLIKFARVSNVRYYIYYMNCMYVYLYIILIANINIEWVCLSQSVYVYI